MKTNHYKIGFLLIGIILAFNSVNAQAKRTTKAINIYELQKDGKYIRNNQNITVRAKAVSNFKKWENAPYLEKSDTGFFYTYSADCREWIELKITDSAKNVFYRKFYTGFQSYVTVNNKSQYVDKIGIEIGKSEYYDFNYASTGIPRSVFPSKDTFRIVETYPRLPETERKLATIGVRAIFNNPKTGARLNDILYTFIDVPNYGRSQQRKELTKMEEIKTIYPIRHIGNDYVSAFGDGALLLFSDEISSEKIVAILKKNAITDFREEDARITKMNYYNLKSFDKFKAVSIKFTKEQLLSLSFLKQLEKLRPLQNNSI